MPKERLNFDTPIAKINESANQFLFLKPFEASGIEKIREKIMEIGLQNIEEYTGKSREELEKVKPGICDRYNTLVLEFKSPDLTFEKYKEIVNEISKITRGKDWKLEYRKEKDEKGNSKIIFE